MGLILIAVAAFIIGEQINKKQIPKKKWKRLTTIK
jgi:hypothetical protein